jgi:hypothetical protein
MEDLSFIYLICGFIIALPIVAFGLAYLLRRARGATLNADLANIIQTQDAILVKPTRVFNAIALVLISGFLVLAVAMLLTSRTLTLYQLISVLFSIVLMGTAVVWLVRGLRKPEIEVNTFSRTIRVGNQGTIDFHNVAGVYMGQRLLSVPTANNKAREPIGGVGVILRNGERVQLATFSGRNYLDRMARFGTMLADALAEQGAPFTTAFAARNNAPNPSIEYAFDSQQAVQRTG